MEDFLEMCKRGEVEEVREALARGVDVNTRITRDRTGLMAAAYGNHEEVVEVLLAQPGVDVNCRNDYGSTALHYACMSDSAQRIFTYRGPNR